MMYNNKLACAIKVDGKVLKEHDDTVYLPFGAEYSFFIKNLHSRRVQVSITIDGEDIADGDTFVVRPNSSINIERFLRNNNEKGNRFKFIERTTGVEQHRGVGVSDGLIRIEYQFEREYPIIYRSPYEHPPMWVDVGSNIGSPLRGGGGRFTNSTGDAQYMANQQVVTSMGSDFDDAPATASVMSAQTMVDGHSTSRGLLKGKSDRGASRSVPANEAGVTVEGSVSNQQFHTVASFPVEDTKHTMVLKLLGETEDNQRVEEAITTKTKLNCPKCARMSKVGVKFCSLCGTSLTEPYHPHGSCKTCARPFGAGEVFCCDCGTAKNII